MRIRYSTHFNRDMSELVAEFISDDIKYPTLAAGGVAERAGEVAFNAADVIGRLVEVLAEKGILSAADVVRVSGRYVDEGSTSLEDDDG